MSEEAIMFKDTSLLTIPHTPGSAIEGGEVVVLDKKVYVAKRDIAASEEGTLDGAGQYRFKKDEAVAFATVGAVVYWDDTANEATETAASNERIGTVTEAALAADTHVVCDLIHAGSIV